MFTKQTVSNCPITSGSAGRIVIPTSILGELVGALDAEPDLEWLILLHGKRLEGGLVYEVEKFSVPPTQLRGSVEVELPTQVVSDDVVGVLHSHHSMGAFMSHTDEVKLNPLFNMSIVISSQLQTEEDYLLGFSYKAVGFATLPCGALGQLRYYIYPEDMEDWPHVRKCGFKRNRDFQGLGDCARTQVTRMETNSYTHIRVSEAACDAELKVTQTGPVFRRFGTGEGTISRQLPPAELQIRSRRSGGNEKNPRQLDAEYLTTRQACHNCGDFDDLGNLLPLGDIYLCVDCYEFFVESRTYPESSMVGGYDELAEWDGLEPSLIAECWRDERGFDVG